MGLLDLHAAQADIGGEKPLQALPRSFGERVEATAAEIFRPNRYFQIKGAREEAWQRAGDELFKATGEKFASPFDSVTWDEAIKPDFQPGEIVKQRQDKIINASRLARARGLIPENGFNPEEIDRYIGEESTRRQQRAGEFEGTGNGIANFLAGAAISSVEPINLLGFVLPPTRALSAAEMRIGQSFMRNVGREAALQAGPNVGLQAVTEGLDASTGAGGTAGEVGMNLAGAAVFGGLLGGGARALHLGWLRLSPAERAAAPLEVRDAFKAIEADALYTGQNRLGLPYDLHERYQGHAMDAVMRGQPVDLASLGATADTPLTALGTILRAQPGADGVRPEIRGLTGAVDRVRALPDTEFQALLREAKPEAFAQIDNIARRETDLEARVTALDREAGQIDVADIVDVDSGARLQDIEAQLAKKGLRKAVRLDLEREREMITQSLDQPGGRIAAELEGVRADFFPEQKAARAAIAAEREALATERASAESVLKGEVDQLRARIDALEVGGRYADDISPDTLAAEFGTDAPGLDGAIQRADLMRQARMVREVVPDIQQVLERAPTDRGADGMPAQQRITSPGDAPAKVPADLTPEQKAVLDAETERVLTKSGPMRDVIMREIEKADLSVKDAQAAMGCAVGGGGIP